MVAVTSFICWRTGVMVGEATEEEVMSTATCITKTPSTGKHTLTWGKQCTVVWPVHNKSKDYKAYPLKKDIKSSKLWT